MWNATWYNFQCNSLNCGMNIEYSDPKDSRQKFNIDIKIIILQSY